MNIDRIAREMVDVEPSVGLEARIRARLGAAAPARTSARLGWTVGAPLATVAALGLVFALVVQGPASRVQSPATTVGAQVSRSLPAEAQSAKVGPEVVTTSLLPKIPTSTLRKPASRLPKVPTSLLTSEEIAWMERRIPSLDPVNALQMDHLRVDSIQPAPLAITPLTMTPIGTDDAGIERRNDR